MSDTPIATERHKKLINYLVGYGLCNKIPNVDAKFYQLCATCAAPTWPTKPYGPPLVETAANPTQMSQAATDQKESADNQIHESATETSASQPSNCVSCEKGKADATVGDSKNVVGSLFCPKPVLPFPLYQETYRKWHGGMDMHFRFRRVRRLRASLVLQPIGAFPSFLDEFVLKLNGSDTVAFFELVQAFLEAFFTGANVRLVPRVNCDSWNITSRLHHTTEKPQLLAQDVNNKLADYCLPSDAYAVVGISWTDLYPSAKQNFVLGQADSDKHTGIISFGRFETNPVPGGPQTTAADCVDVTEVNGELIWKVFKVISHETCHLFFMAHCVFFDCLMNESRSVSEAMNQPLHLCPVCARKLAKVLRLGSVMEHYRAVYNFLNRIVSISSVTSDRLRSEFDWLARCLSTFSSNEVT